MNVLTSKWLQVVDSDGNKTKIRPLDIVKRPSRFASGSWEVDAGSIQLLIALAQTYLAPESNREWKKLLVDPPDVRDFERAVEKDILYFEVFGDGYRFMQVCPSRRKAFIERDSVKDSEELLVSTYSSSKVKKAKNAFFFDSVKNIDPVKKSISMDDIIPLLYHTHALSLNKRCGNGQAYVRGNGVPTLIIEGKDLWETVWFNVLNQKDMLSLFGTRNIPEFKFPWLWDEIPSDLESENFHPLTTYWMMTRDIFIPYQEEGVETLLADVLNKENTSGSCGPKFSGWKHPLSPYQVDDSGVSIPKLSQDFNAGDWTGFRYGIGQDDTIRRSPNIRSFQTRQQFYSDAMGTGQNSLPPVHVFGTVMNQGKIVSIVERKFPLLTLDEKVEPAVLGDAKFLIDLVEDTQEQVGRAVKRVMPDSNVEWYDWRDEVRLWPSFEEAYFEYLDLLAKRSIQGADSSEEQRSHCVCTLMDYALKEFNRLTGYMKKTGMKVQLSSIKGRTISLPSEYKRLEKKLNKSSKNFIKR